MQRNEKPRVLIVDDEKGLRLGTKRLLEKEGYSVATAENGNEGILAGTSEEFDLALIDLKMPDIDGIDVLKAINKIHPNTISYIVTAYASYETAIEATKLGAFGYILKPFTPEELLFQLKQGYDRRLIKIEAENWKKEREERLLEVAFEKTRLNTIINSIKDGVLVVNKDGEAVLYNPGALKYLSLEKIVLESYIVDKLHPEVSELIDKFLQSNITEQKSYSKQIEIKPSGELFVEATASSVLHSNGSLAGVALVIKNITAIKKIEHLKSQFVSMVSHELKAPLAAVFGYLKLLDDPSISLSDEQRKNFIGRSEFRLDSLLKMVNDLLDISRMEMKTVKRELINLNVADIIRSIVELFQNEINKRNLNLEFVSIQDLPFIQADSEEINRLFTNLISNAIKYNRENGTINISVNFNEHFVVASIEDSGIGIKEEEQHKLFHEFYRARNEFTKDISGTGLGLSIVKRIIDSYSGKIELKSEFGRGTKIVVSLPFQLNLSK